jgi:hypothetical protein
MCHGPFGKWSRSVGAAWLLCLACLAVPRQASAQAAGSAPAAAASSTEFGGLVDVYFDFYSTKPAGDAPFRNFDTKHSQFALTMAEVWLAKAPSADSRAGFKVKLNLGPASTNFIHAAEPGGQVFQNIQEAYASYLAPAGRGVQIDAGIFVTPAGAEVIEAKDNYNYSRGLLFVLAVPAYHSGVRFTYSPNDKVTLVAGLVNGWNDVVDNNTGKTVIGAVTFKPTGGVTLVENYLVGPETAGTNDPVRNLSDTILTYTYNPKVSLIANYDYGHDNGGHWQGIAAYMKYQATPKVGFSPRFEFYDDASGFTTGAVQKLKDLTATLELKAADSLLWRLEYRDDFSDQAVFHDDRGAAKKHQQSIGISLLYSFTSKVQ